ncbi:hypothetical protein, partial [Streptomyces sp. SID3343]|uniref:hypothetical protein n=1 Tax=Streptomyces sp. SID3343 TaxID=2690260 RepID=UPI0013C168D2
MDTIAPGHHLYPGPDGAWRYSTPDERFVRVQGPHEQLESMARHLAGERSPAVSAASRDEDFATLARNLRDLGVIVTHTSETGAHNPSTPTSPTAPQTVHIDGTGPVAVAVAALLDAEPTLA